MITSVCFLLPLNSLASYLLTFLPWTGVDVEAMVDQNVWNVDRLRDQKRLAPGKGPLDLFLFRICMYICLTIFSHTSVSQNRLYS